MKYNIELKGWYDCWHYYVKSGLLKIRYQINAKNRFPNQQLPSITNLIQFRIDSILKQSLKKCNGCKIDQLWNVCSNNISIIIYKQICCDNLEKSHSKDKWFVHFVCLIKMKWCKWFCLNEIIIMSGVKHIQNLDIKVKNEFIYR